tara:strand:- start:311 stop:586 length:276 start_codon:yes stop_codon:yes gene_type:complete
MKYSHEPVLFSRSNNRFSANLPKGIIGKNGSLSIFRQLLPERSIPFFDLSIDLSEGKFGKWPSAHTEAGEHPSFSAHSLTCIDLKQSLCTI